MQSASGKAPNHDFTFTSCLGIPNKQTAPPLDPQLTLDKFPGPLSKFSPHTTKTPESETDQSLLQISAALQREGQDGGAPSPFT